MLARALSPAIAVLLASIPDGAKLCAQQDAARPLPTGPEVLTQQRYLANKARFWAAALVAECKAGGGMREEWQPLVDDVMGAYAKAFCAYVGTDEDSPKLVRSCDRLNELGCDLPVLRLVVADALFFSRRFDEARTAFAAAARAIETRQSPLLRFWLHESTRRFHQYNKEIEPALEAAAARDACLVELAASPELGAGHERFFLDLVMEAWNGRVGPDDVAMLERMEQKAGKPSYALLVLRAKYHHTMAWAARGEGIASSVGAANFEKFGQHLEIAAKLLTQAAEMCPQHPEAPALMVTTLGPGGANHGELRRWFDRAVAAQLDWRDAYSSLMHYLQPRWGGSQQAIFDLGLECLATKRFDTAVPTFYRMAIHYVALGVEDSSAVWADAEVQKGLEELDRGCIAVAAEVDAKRTATTHRIVALALGGRAQEAAALCQQVKHNLDTDALEIYGVTAAWLAKTLRPHRTDYAPATIRAGDVFAGYATVRTAGSDRAVALTSHGNALTNDRVNGQYTRWLSQTFVAAYDKAGKHDPEWDADARTLLSAFGGIVDGATSKADRELAERLLEIACKDPLTLYVVTRTLDGDDDVKRMTRTLAGLLPKLEKSQPAAFAWWAKGHLGDMARRAGQPNVGSRLLSQMREHMVTAMADPMFAGDNRRHYIKCLWDDQEFARAGNDWVTDRMIDAIASLPGADPWLVHVVTGLHNARKAKHGRGSASERAANRKLAAEHLTKAHELCPQFPEAAVGMIVIASLEPSAVSAREWFDCAVSAQIDYSPAYAAYVDSLRPRHGGSVLAMYRFAVECLESKRFDTDVPLWYARTMERIQQELPEPREAWASVGVADCLRRMFDGYDASRRKSVDAASLNAGRCVLAWAGGRYADALASWDAAGRKLDQRWFAIAGQEDADLIEADLRHLDAQRHKK